MQNGAFEVTGTQIDAAGRAGHRRAGGPGREGAPNKDYVGKSPQVLARAIGLEVPAGDAPAAGRGGREHPCCGPSC